MSTKIECELCGMIKEKYHWQKHHQKNRKIWNAGFTKSTHPGLKKQSISLKTHWEENGHPAGMKGKKHSIETRKKMSEQRKGEKNRNWKGGVTEGIRLFRKSKRYQKWRKEVLKIYDNICCKCGQYANVAHHIKPVKKYPELRFEISNGQGLCVCCHNSIHKKKKEG